MVVMWVVLRRHVLFSHMMVMLVSWLLVAATTHGVLSQKINQWLTVMHNNQTNDEE